MATSVPSRRRSTAAHPAPALRRRHRAHRALLAVAALAAVAVGALGVSAPTGATSLDPSATTDPADAAAGWLARQLVDGDHFEAVFGDTAYPDQGLTIDAVLGFAAAGGSGDAAAAAVAWLGGSATASGYLGDGATESYAGATAKLALLAQVAGVDPTAFGDDSLDLIARLQALELADGHFADVSLFGDYSNSIGQALAIIVLARQGGTAPSSDAVDFLLLSRCTDGGFALELAPAPVDCTSGVDTTAYAAQALAAAGRTADAAAALDALEGYQQASGGFGTDGSSAPNANSTGLAAQALAAGGRAAPAADAATYLLGLQVGCAGATADRGAIAFDGGGFDPGSAPRATAQALLGLGDAGLETLTLAGADPLARVLLCQVPTTATTSTTAPTTTTSTTTTTVAPTPAAPVPATPTFTG